MGVVVSKLNAAAVFRMTGDIPQNVNFALKGVIARGFLDIHGIEYGTAESLATKGAVIVAAKARQFTVPVECWK
jgi:serine protease Do